MSSLEQVRSDIFDVKPYLMEKYLVKSLSIFGSYARKEQQDDSDIDILVDFQKTPDLLTFIEMEEYLSDKLQVAVDLVPKRKLKAQLKDQILSEAIAI